MSIKVQFSSKGRKPPSCALTSPVLDRLGASQIFRNLSLFVLSFTLLISVGWVSISQPAMAETVSSNRFPTSIPGLDGPGAKEVVDKMVAIFREEEPRISSVVERVIAVQRQIHKNPEVAFQEYETRDLLMGEHEKNGATVHKIGATGFVAIYEGRGPIPVGTRRPVIAARGELDAIVGQERSGLPWASTKEGRNPWTGQMTPIFHGCGHDLHSAYLVGVGELLSRHLDSFPGTFVAIGQPAEENLQGMRRMIRDGLFDVVEPTELWGIHLLIRRIEGELQIPYGTIQGATVDAELSDFANGLLKGNLPEGKVLHSNRPLRPRDDFWVLTDPRANGGRDIPGLLFFLGSDPIGDLSLYQHSEDYWINHDGPVPTLGVKVFWYTLIARALKLTAE